MTKSDHIRELGASGMTPSQINLAHGYSHQLISRALNHPQTRPVGRPRTLARCPHCGQPMSSTTDATDPFPETAAADKRPEDKRKLDAARKAFFAMPQNVKVLTDLAKR